jgi:hypothetical protein
MYDGITMIVFVPEGPVVYFAGSGFEAKRQNLQTNGCYHYDVCGTLMSLLSGHIIRLPLFDRLGFCSVNSLLGKLLLPT